MLSLLLELTFVNLTIVAVESSRHRHDRLIIPFHLFAILVDGFRFTLRHCCCGCELLCDFGSCSFLDPSDILFDEVLLELSSRFAFISVIDVEDELTGVNSLHKVL